MAVDWALTLGFPDDVLNEEFFNLVKNKKTNEIITYLYEWSIKNKKENLVKVLENPTFRGRLKDIIDF